MMTSLLRRYRSNLTSVLSGTLALSWAGPAWATTYTVNTPSDIVTPGACAAQTPNKCSLRGAIGEANAHIGYDIVVLQGITYSLTQSVQNTLKITDDIDVYGAASGGTVVSAGQHSRVFEIATTGTAYAYFSDMKIQDGLPGDVSGGGIRQTTGALWADRITITNNRALAGYGGGISVGTEFGCTDCTISNNQTDLDAGGTQMNGGGIFITPGARSYLYRTTISANKAGRGGGMAGGGYLEMQNSTISGNVASAGGGGFKTQDDAAWWSISFSTIAFNTANNASPSNEIGMGGGFMHTSGTLEIGKTIIAANLDRRTSSSPLFSPDCATTAQTAAPFLANKVFWSAADNIIGNIGNNHCSFTNIDISQTGFPNAYDAWGDPTSPLDLKLDVLKNNGGYVATHKLLAGSLAIDWASSGNIDPSGPDWLFDCPGNDETLTSRPRGAWCDSGSYEYR
jgi:hypothetical protein